MTQTYIGLKVVTAYEQKKEGKEGYGVIYEDGYTSWSPKEAFEKAYIPIDPEYIVKVDINIKNKLTGW